jgi:cell division protein FtsB
MPAFEGSAPMIQRVMAFLSLTAIGGVVLYYSYHGLAGEYGLLRWSELQAEEARLRSDLEGLEAERSRMETRLARLRDSSLDLDYLEEIARVRLAYVRPDEVLVALR